MKFILGKKLEMTQIWKDEVAVAVTKVKVEPGVVVQMKTLANDGYNAAVLGFGKRREKNINKPQLGQMRGLGNFRYLKEMRYNLTRKTAEKAEFETLQRGDMIGITTFEVGDVVGVKGVSKGRGFQGGVKRHRFHGQDATHGTKDQVRMPGSVGAGEPQHVFKGTRMAGRMGGESVTVKNLKVVDLNIEEGVLYIKGAIPGARNSVVIISGEGELKKFVPEVKQAEPVVAETAEEVKAEEVVEAKEEVKAEEKKEEVAVTPEAKVEEAKPEAEKTEEKKEEAVPAAEAKEEKKEEPEKEEVKEKAAPAPKKVEEKFADDYLEKFNQLPAEEKEKYSTAEITAAIAELEEKHKIDLVPVVTKVMVKEIKLEELANHFITNLKLDEAKANEIAKDITDKVFGLVK